MKHKPILLLIALITSVSAISPQKAEAVGGVSISYFYDNLDPYGEWMQVPGAGYCWRPNGVDVDWQPYTDGYWTYTDAGWTWVSYEDFGSITYHYGRWSHLEDYGWVWTPGYEWGPAWVSWRKSDDYVGWAPLPPEVEFRASIGISISVDRDYDIGPRFYSFCPVRHFGAPVMRNVMIDRSRNVTIINNTVNITNITVNNDRHHGRTVFNGGPDYRDMARRTDQPIQTLKLERRSDWSKGGGHVAATRQVGNQLVIQAPEVTRPSKPVAPPKVAQVISKPKFDKGWAGVSNPAEKEQIRQKFQQESSAVPRHAPAKPVDVQQLQAVLPTKADPKGIPGGIKPTQPAVHPQPVARETAPVKRDNVGPIAPPAALQPNGEAKQEHRGIPGKQPGETGAPVRAVTKPFVRPSDLPEAPKPVQPSEKITHRAPVPVAPELRRNQPEPVKVDDQRQKDAAAQEHRRQLEASKQLQRTQELRRTEDLRRQQTTERPREIQAERPRPQTTERPREIPAERPRPQMVERPRPQPVERQREPQIQRSTPAQSSGGHGSNDDNDKKKHKDDH